ncbi:MAG: sigma 54-interacting transcriptional regulator, partial [Syntrophales bacterium]
DCFRSQRTWSESVVYWLSLVSEIFGNALMSKKLHLQADGFLKFEKLLSEISSTYANLATGEVDNIIEFGLQKIGQYLDVDRCHLVQFWGDRSAIRSIYSWANEGIEPLANFIPFPDRSFPWAIDRLKNGEIVQCSNIADLPYEANLDKQNFLRFDTKSFIWVPVFVGRSIMGFLAISAVNSKRNWPEETVQRLRLLADIVANALAYKQKELEVGQDAFLETETIEEPLEADHPYLQEEIKSEFNFHGIIGQSVSLKEVLAKIKQIAPIDTTVLILGETGTGKNLVARAIHDMSLRRERPMVQLSCPALPLNLIESELFGHEKGAFTGAQARRYGRFEIANDSTLFLDEIGELPLETQAKLLRVLQEGELERIGSSHTLKVNVRVIAASNLDLEQRAKQGQFRRDLWYRLSIFPIMVPPLRHRKEDIPLLVNWFVNKFSRKMGKPIKFIPPDVMNTLQKYHWSGNVRELENVIERALINTQGPSLQLMDGLNGYQAVHIAKAQRLSLADIERNYIVQILEETKGRIEGPKGAASILGINPSTLRARMRKLGIQKSMYTLQLGKSY